MIRLVKKFISLLASAFIVLIVSGFISLHPIAQPPAYAQDQPAAICNDISMVAGKTLTDPFKPTETNSGQFDFNLPDAAYQACTRDLATTVDGITSEPIEGWVWNTNVGDTSLYCKAGKNRGADCGVMDYGVRYVTSANRLEGFAWGPNIGWISFYCFDGLNAGTTCGNPLDLPNSIDYGVKVATANGQDAENCNDMTKGDLYGYAYAESVGYMNLCGAKLIPSQAYTATASIASSDLAAGVDLSNAKIYANGVDNYQIKVQVLDDGVAVGSTADRQISIQLTGITNTVKTDQVTAGAAIGGAGASAFVWNGVTKDFVSTITSIAPTNDSNVFNATGLTITIRDWNDVTIKEIPKVIAQNFKFIPLAEVTKISSIDATGAVIAENTVAVAPNEFQEVDFTVSKGGMAAAGLADNNIQIISQVYDCSNNYDFFFDSNGDKQVGETEGPIQQPGVTFPEIAKAGVCSQQGIGQGLSSIYSTTLNNAKAWIYTALQADGNPGDTTESNAVALQTFVAYTLQGKAIRYFSKNTTDGSVLNQAAKISGNVRLDIFDLSGMPVADKLTESLGQRAQSRRTVFSKAIKTSLGGKTPILVGGGANARVLDVAALNAGGILYYKRDKNIARDKPCTVVLGNTDTVDLNFSGTSTIVADGCDVFIDSNLIAQGNARLGIIALEDFTMPSNKRRGGNVYICGKVTDVETNMVLDNSLFSYGVDSVKCGNVDKTALVDQNTGYPVFGGAVRDALKNQLSIKGSIVGNNTYGGSMLTPPLLGSGKQAVTEKERAEAKLFDLNFLRYAKTVADVDEFGSPIQCWADDVKCAKSMSGPVCDCAVNSASYNGIVTITYRGPASTQPIFNLVEQK